MNEDLAIVVTEEEKRQSFISDNLQNNHSRKNSTADKNKTRGNQKQLLK